MFDEMTLSGKQRGYKQAGKKLMPRDASVYYYGKSNKERRRAFAAEAKHNAESEREYLDSIGQEPSRSEARVERTRQALSTRRAIYVERLFEAMITGDNSETLYQAAFVALGKAQWRYFSALDNDFCTREASDADEQLLRYARG
jgi:hypothetical protein